MGRAVRRCSTREDQPDRLDFAIVDRPTDAYLGDLSINDLNGDNLSCGFRIALLTGRAGRGYGTEAIRLIIDHLFSLGIPASNSRSTRSIRGPPLIP